MARLKRPLRAGSDSPWRVVTYPAGSAPGGGGSGGAGEAAGADVGVWAGVRAGVVELWPAGAGEHGPESVPVAGHYRLALVRETDRWLLVTECVGRGGQAGEPAGGEPAGLAAEAAPARWSTEAECLGQFRDEVQRLWGEAVWFALLKAAATTVADLAPKVMAPKLELLLPRALAPIPAMALPG